MDEALTEDLERKLLHRVVAVAFIDVANDRSQTAVSDAACEMRCFDRLELNQPLLFLEDAVNQLEALLNSLSLPQINP